MEEIPYINDDRSNFPSWKAVSDADGNKVSPVVFCACGEPLGMYNHNIDSDGIVSPSVCHHPDNDNGCGWHENIKLNSFRKIYDGLSFSKKSV